MMLGEFARWPVALVSMVLAAGLLSGCEVKKASNTTGAPKISHGTSPSIDGNSTSVASEIGKSTAESKTISAEGSSTVYPICQAFAVEFEKKSKHTVSVGRQGTNGGYKKLLNRQADIWNASRPIDAVEANELQKKGIEWLELNVAVDGIVIAVHFQNSWCSNLTCAQLKQMWEPDSKVKMWRDLDPAWPAEPILLYGADTDSGTFDYFTEVINGKKKATNTKYTPASDDNVLVQGVAANKGALGYIPFGYYIENTDKLKSVGVSPSKDSAEATAPFVQPSVETILSGEYAPLTRPLFMYVNRESLKRHEVAEFLKFAVSEESQPLIEKRGFVRVKEEARQEAMTKLEDALAAESATKKE